VLIGAGLTGLTATERSPLARAQALPLGACGLVVVATPVSYLMAMRPGGRWVVTAILLAIIVGGMVALAMRGMRPTHVRRRAGILGTPVALGGAAGLAALIPVFAQNAPTTLAYGNFDGWYFAARGDWLTRHPWGRTLTEQTGDPLSTVAVWSDRFHLPQGVDVSVAYVQSMLGLDGYQVLGVLGAVAIAVALCGWLTLWDALDGRRDGGRRTLLAAAGVVSPVFVVMYGENFMAQLWGAALWPFLMATLVRVGMRPSWRTVLTAAIATAAAVTMYPANLPWILLGAAGALVVGVHRRVTHEGTGVRPAITRAALGVIATIVAVVALAPAQVVRLVEFTRFAQDIGAGAATAAPLNGRAALAVLSGTQTNLDRVVESGRVVLAVLLLMLIVAVVAMPARRRWFSGPLALAVSVAVTTAIVFMRAQGRGETYMMNKALMTGGALLAGLAFVAAASGDRTPRPRGMLAAGLAMLVVWGGMSAFLIRRTTEGWAGFRSDDRALGRQMAALGPDDVLLVEGAAETVPDSFQYRMTASYYAATATDGPVVGLGSTDSYLTAPTLIPKGDARWRPTRAWNHVVTRGPHWWVSGRRRTWADREYTMWRAPTLDATPFGTGWDSPVLGGSATIVPARGPVEILVSNTGDRPRVARVTVDVRNRLAGHTLHIEGGERPVTADVPAGEIREVRTTIRVPAGGVGTLQLTDSPPAPEAAFSVLDVSVDD